jgi:hypothetical protein
VSAANRRADLAHARLAKAHARLAALEKAQRPDTLSAFIASQEKLPGDFEEVLRRNLWKLYDDAKPAPPAATGDEEPQQVIFVDGKFVQVGPRAAPGDATGSDEELVARARQQARRERDGAAREITGCSVMAAALFDALATRLDELRREQGVITIGDGLRVGRHWVEALQARADAAEAKVAGIAGLVRKIGPDTVADCAHIIRKDWPLCAEILDAALTTPAQRSESNDGG